MINIKEFVDKYNVEKSKNLIDNNQINVIEKILKVKLGNELKNYILNYGYLAYKNIELYGVNSKQGVNSDMIKQTIYLHKYFPKTCNYVAVENQGDGDYYLVDSADNVYRYVSEQDRLVSANLKLFDYILYRFKQADN